MKLATRVTSKGQVVIPKELRERLRWREGMRLRVEDSKDGGIVLRPDRAVDEIDALLDEVTGCLGVGDAIADLESEHRVEIAADERWFHRHRGRRRS